MFDFSYVNKIETNLAVQSNSLHVKQKIAPLRRKELKPHSIALPSTLSLAIFSNHCLSAVNVYSGSLCRGHCRQ